MALLDRFFGHKEKERDTARVTVDLFDEEFLKRLESLSLMSRRAMSGSRRGDRRSRKRGSGVEFADHKNYVPGDDIRFLDVGVYQRFGKLLIRMFEEEEDISLFFLIDTSASMGTRGGSKLNHAAQVAAALAYIGLSGLDRVSVTTLSDKVSSRMPATRGKQRVFRVLRFLSEMKAQGSTDLGQALRSFVAQNKRRGIAILMSDLFDPQGFEAGLNVLRFNGFESIVLQLVDPLDVQLPEVGDVRLTDVESGSVRELSITKKVGQQVEQAIAARNEHIERYCASRGVSHVALDVSVPFDQLVLSVLRRGGILK